MTVDIIKNLFPLDAVKVVHLHRELSALGLALLATAFLACVAVALECRRPFPGS